MTLGKWIGFLCGTVLAIGGISVASAEDYVIAAQTCVPDHTTLQNDEYQANVSLSQKTGITGQSQFYCPIPDEADSFIGNVFATFANTDSGGSYLTTVHLKRIDKDTGSVSLVDSIASNPFGNHTADVFVADDSWDVTLDYAEYYYFLELEIDRPSSPLYTPKIYGIRLTSDNP